MTDLEKLIESNAKAIEALTSDIQEMRRDRDVMYGLMQILTNQQAQLWGILKNLDDRRAQLAKGQTQFSDQEQQLIEILKKVTND